MASEIPQNSEALEKLPMEPKYTREWKPPTQLLALMRSQSDEVDYLGENKRRVKTKVMIPETNLWGRKMPKSRVRNTTRKWYAKQTDYIFPPLPENERQNLRSLAIGEQEWSRILRRTRVGQPSDTELLEQDLKETILNGPRKGHTFQDYVEGRPHELTDRYMRRLWAYIYKHVPTMSYNPDTKRWEVFWHDVSKKSMAPDVADTDQDEILFGDLMGEPEVQQFESAATASIESHFCSVC